MFNTIFKKQFFLTTAIILISFVAMSIILSQVFREYFTNRQIDMLTEHGKKISYLFEEAYRNSRVTGIINLNRVNNEIGIIYQYSDTNVIFINTEYTVVSTTINVALESLGVNLYREELKPLIEEGTMLVLRGSLRSVFGIPVLTVGYPLKIDGEIMGAVLLNSSLPQLDQTISDLYRITVFCITFTGVISFIFVYLLSKTISTPLKEMNKVAKTIANGNFEQRIHVHSIDEVGQLAVTFNEMAESLHKQEKLRGEFISNISHDLRSPLTSMRGFLQAIIDGTIPEEKHKHYVAIVLEESKRLSKLANDILDSNTLQEGSIKLNKTNFDLNELIRKVILTFEHILIDKSLRVIAHLADEQDYVYADYEKIQRVLYNLIDNAIKFTDKGGTITVETTIKGKKVYVSIVDTGRGISSKEQKRVFDRFYKADASRGEDKRGSGLGLCIVRDFLKAHDEMISLESECGIGTKFTFALKIANEKDCY